MNGEDCRTRLCIVLGMHRSGTSALTRALSLLGAALPNRLMPPSADNETGFWEPASIVDVHDEILAGVGARWDEVAPFPSEWFASAAARSYAEQLATLVVEEFGDAPLAVLKDPRLCRLMPLWRQVLDLVGARPLIVMAVRHPLEVAASLAARNGLSREHCLLLWLDHVLAAERDTRGLPRFVVHYDNLLDAPETTLRRVARALDLPLPGTVDDATPGVPSRRYRHHRADLDMPSSEASMGGWVRAVYERLRESGTLRPADEALFDAIRREHETAQRLYLPMLDETRARMAVEGTRLGDQMAALVQDCSELRDRLDQSRTEVEGLRDRLDQSRTEAEGLRDRLDQSRTEVEGLRDRLDQSRTEAEGLRDRLDQSRTEAEDLRDRLDQSRTEAENLRDRLDRSNGELSQTVALLQATSRRQTMAYCLRRLLRRCKDVMLSRGQERRLAALIRSSGRFDEVWYLGTYPDVADAAMDPILHYLRFGAREGRRPSRWFDPDDYLLRHPEAAGTGEIPFLHYIRAVVAPIVAG